MKKFSSEDFDEVGEQSNILQVDILAVRRTIGRQFSNAPYPISLK